MFGSQSPFGNMMQMGFDQRSSHAQPESPADKTAREERERKEKQAKEDRKRKLNGDPTIEEESTMKGLHSFVARVEDKVRL